MIFQTRKFHLGITFYTSTKLWLCYTLITNCLSVYVSDEHMHWFQCGFYWMATYRTDSTPIEIGNIASQVKVTVTENVSQHDECQSYKIQMQTFFFQIIARHWIKKFIHV